MHQNEEYKLRLAYSSIIYGFSRYTHNNEQIFIKHFSPLDNFETDFLYQEHYQNAADKGYPTEKDRLDQLVKDKLWSDSDENHIKNLKISIDSLVAAKRKAFLKRDIDSINSQIKEQEELLRTLIFKRENLIGSTVERFARRNVDAYLIHRSFYKNELLTKLMYSKEDFDDLGNEETRDLFSIYNEVMENFSERNIKKIALSPFFQNAFALCDNVYEFYGKPVCYLTNFQIHLSAYGGYYKNVLSSDVKPPDEILTDPDKLEDWFNSKSNADQMLDRTVKNDDGNVSIMGATKEDLKAWGYDQQESTLGKATKEAGKELSMEEIMKIQGVGQ